jgi:phage/plasmid primase-like uncharacterized protein
MTAVSDGRIEQARAVPIEDELARRGIKLRRTGAELNGPCPVCGGTDRFAVHLKKQCWNCRCCGVGGNVIRLVQHVDGVDFKTAVETLVGDAARPAARPARAQPDNGEDERRRLDLANAIWHATQPFGPEAIAYFNRRGIDIDMVPEHGGLRFHPRCPWQGARAPCVVGRFTGAIDNQPRGIWRRPLTGEKPKAFGPTAGCVIRLWPDEAVERSLVIGEGVETVLAAATLFRHRGRLLRPAWAATTAGNMESFPVLSGIEALTLLVDNDTNGAGQRAAAICSRRWTTAGRPVTRLTPKKAGADFNDLVFQW